MPGPPRRPVLPWLGLALLWAAAVLLAHPVLLANRAGRPNALRRRGTARAAREHAPSAAHLHAAASNVRRAVLLTNDGRDERVRNALNLTYSHMATVAVCPGWEADGFPRVVVAWQGSSSVEGGVDQRLYFAVSSDNLGRVWHNAAPVPIPTPAGQWAPVLHWDETKRRLWLFFSETTPACMRRPQGATNTSAALPPRWVIGGSIMVTSYTQKRGWEQPHVVYSHASAYGIPKLIANRLVVTRRGDWVLPFWQQKSWTRCVVRHVPPAASGVLLSSDQGRTWKAYGELMVENSWGIEGTIAEPSPGRLVMLLRTSSGYVYQSMSYDGGLKWSEPTATVLPNPDSKVSLVSLPPQRPDAEVAELLVAYNDHGKTTNSDGMQPRRRLRLALSRDGGATWRRVGAIDDRVEERAEEDGDEGAEVWKHYPTLALRGDGTVLVVYSRSWHAPPLAPYRNVHSGIWFEEHSVERLRAEYDAQEEERAKARGSAAAV